VTFGFVDCWSYDLLDQARTVVRRYDKLKARLVTVSFFAALPPAFPTVTLKR
jgi:hypothetical protein